jgi:hypothetical protein
MGKPKSAAKAKLAKPAAEETSVSWPALPTFSANATIEDLLPGEIVQIHNLFSAKDCKTWVDALGRLPMEPPRAPQRGEATRTNYRFSVQDPDFAKRLWTETALSTLLPPVLGAKACGLNSNIRVYRYDSATQAFFGPHYDDSVQDAGLSSRWTLLVYLTGIEDGLQGGQTVFHCNEKRTEPLVVELERGAALLHKHGADCLLHEARPVLAGVKWVLRSDVMFAR